MTYSGLREVCFMKKTAVLIIGLILVFCLAACGSGETKAAPADSDVGGRTYIWEKEGFGGDFTLTLQKYGSYQYYVGYLSSYIGYGDWSEEDGVITLTERSGYDYVFRFAVDGDELVYLAEGSDAFMGVNVEDGDRFLSAGRHPDD